MLNLTREDKIHWINMFASDWSNVNVEYEGDDSAAIFLTLDGEKQVVKVGNLDEILSELESWWLDGK